jgi:diaminohydroxyphosphoribosylaminopyrimidine deaminase/5-amino-6-(5-phosphoribosylamino)uracil reductase
VLKECGVELIDVAPAGDRPDMGEMLRALAARGITRALVEGGGRLTGALLGDGLIDRIVWFRAGSVFGGDGTPVAAAFGVDHLAQAPRFVRLSVDACGDDTVETYALARGQV